jgi:osmotically-inducible protein OsmY
MPGRWRDDDWRDNDTRRRLAEDPYGGRRGGDGDFGYRTSQYRDYPDYDYGPDTDRYSRYYAGGGWNPYLVGPSYWGSPGGPSYYPDRGRGYGGERDRYRSGERGWLDKAGDEVSSWFGDEDAERRREMDARQQGHRGRGPRGYMRSDERIIEDVNDRLTEDWMLDASDIEVSASNGEVTLSGTVSERRSKRRAEDLAESVSGVKDVHNTIRVQQSSTGDTAGQTPYRPGTSGEGTSEDYGTNRTH